MLSNTKELFVNISKIKWKWWYNVWSNRQLKYIKDWFIKILSDVFILFLEKLYFYHTISILKSPLSLGFFFKHLSTKSLKASEKIPAGNVGGGSFTM